MLGQFGLHELGRFTVGAADGVPAVDVGHAATELVLVGHVGSSHWRHFVSSAEYREGLPDPLDRWSRRVGTLIATRTGGCALYPFEGPPFLPFQRWAMRADPALSASPLGLLIHPRKGLWQAYRFALALPAARTDRYASRAQAASRDPVDSADVCARCVERPCLAACPADAVREPLYDWSACIAYLRVASADDECRKSGCRSRRACPVGVALSYDAEHARFTMDAFLAGGIVASG